MALPTSSVSGSVNSANSQNWSTSGSQTYGTEATSAARAAAEYANELAIQRWKMQAEYNAQQAEIQRNWQEKMANSVYQRTMQDMRSAGLNPILAAGGGLGTASVSGGAAASVGAPDSYMPNVYPDSISSAQSQGNSQSNGSSWGESGFATFLDSMTSLLAGLKNAMTSGQTINIGLTGLDSLIKDTGKDYNKDGKTDVTDSIEGIKQIKNGTESIGNWLLNELNPFNSPLFGDLKDRTKKAKEISEKIKKKD